ncbi:MAG: peptidoglycan-binding protein [Anaerolineae bacterium]|nr:peptidoglycan-binding protein [Anaerolineae bacterium]
MALEKAKLKYKSWVPPVFGEIPCQFNPASLTISKGTNWVESMNPSFNAPPLSFAGGQAATYKLSLIFDQYSLDDSDKTDPDFKDIRQYTNKLLRLTLRGLGYSNFLVPYCSPPTVKFIWGPITLFTAVVEHVDISYTLFAQDGTPIRAKAEVSFKQKDFMDDILPAQNPTSRTDARKTRIVSSQHRLDQIAYEEYNDSRYWRLLAEANHLDDPFNLQDGQLLVIPQDIRE